MKMNNLKKEKNKIDLYCVFYVIITFGCKQHYFSEQF